MSCASKHDHFACEPFRIVLFYRYFDADVDWLQTIFRDICEDLEMLGRVLIASEGVNGTFAASTKSMDEFVERMEAHECFAKGKVDWKFSDCPPSEVLPFPDLSIRIVKSIIAAGPQGDKVINQQIAFDESSFGGLKGGGEHLSPQEWNKALKHRPDGAILIDVRNQFECDVGAFEGSQSVATTNYTETWKNLDAICNLDEVATNEGARNTPETVFMYCTGGIRCEKASAYLKGRGVPQVYQLQGGIHRYLEEYSDGGLFKGKNYTFDSRVGPDAATIDEPDVSAEEKSGGRGGKDLLGECLYCSCSYDTYSGKRTCTVCRALLLVCPACVEANPYAHEYHCKAHMYLRHCYFTVLDSFSPNDLAQQREELMRLHDAMLAPTRATKEEAKAAAANKFKRRTLLRQVARLDERASRLAAGNVAVTEETKGLNPQVAWWVRQKAES